MFEGLSIGRPKVHFDAQQRISRKEIAVFAKKTNAGVLARVGRTLSASSGVELQTNAIDPVAGVDECLRLGGSLGMHVPWDPDAKAT